MSMVTDVTTSDQWFLLDTQKIKEMGEICDSFSLDLTDRYMLVNADTQRLHLIALGKLMNSYPISTALNGIGQIQGTGQTPLGLHFVATKIGDGAQPFEIFESRISTGKIAEADVDEARIVGRILWLQGAQPGFNKGKDLEGNVVDSHDRYIYIHGTNDIANIGKSVSAGCVRMKPDDVIDLFGKVAERTPVYIYKA
jgi:hypothetical protein